MSEPLKIGDVVRLASGSQPMTVTRIDAQEDDNQGEAPTVVTVWWYDGDMRVANGLPVEALHREQEE